MSRSDMHLHICRSSAIQRPAVTQGKDAPRHQTTYAERNHGEKEDGLARAEGNCGGEKKGLAPTLVSARAPPALAHFAAESRLRAADCRGGGGEAALHRHGNKGGAPPHQEAAKRRRGPPGTSAAMSQGGAPPRAELPAPATRTSVVQRPSPCFSSLLQRPSSLVRLLCSVWFHDINNNFGNQKSDIFGAAFNSDRFSSTLCN